MFLCVCDEITTTYHSSAFFFESEATSSCSPIAMGTDKTLLANEVCITLTEASDLSLYPQYPDTGIYTETVTQLRSYHKAFNRPLKSFELSILHQLQ